LTNFLIKVDATFYARLDVPKDLQQHYGKKVLKKSLRTKDIREAKALLNLIIGEWKTDFQRVRGSWRQELFEAVQPLNDLIRYSPDQQAVEAAKTSLQAIQAQAKAKFGDTPEIPTDEWQREYQQSLTHKIRNPGKLVALPDNTTGPVSQIIEDIAQGRIVPKSDLFREQLRQKFSAFQSDHVEPKTHDMRLGALKEIAKYFQINKLPLDKAGVAAYLETIKTQALTTKKRKLAAGKLYFDFLRDENLVSENAINPFSGHKLREKQKDAARTKRQPFRPSHIEQLYNEAIDRNDLPLADCIMIDAYTGMRIEEVCQLKTTSIDEDLLIVDDAKTEAGIREIPIHPALKQRIQELCETSEDGFLIPSSAENKYGKRSDTISKRFATIKKALSFGPEHVFHSIRKTVATTLEHAGITESVAADILGHEKPTMTFGLYSGGSSLKQRQEAIGVLSYKFRQP